MSVSFMELGTADSTESAANKVAHHVEQMLDTSDFFDKLTQSGTTPVSGLGDKFYVKGAPEFVSTRRMPIPSELQMQMNNIHSEFSMGFFKQISRVWVVIDNNLYMWNYETNDDLAFFDSSDSAILKVALVDIKKGVFEPNIQYGLVVGTIADICLYPVFDCEENGQKYINIDAKRCFKIALDGATINDIAYTSSGRVFYTADDQLFEFQYEKQNGWFGSTSHKCRGVNQTASILGTIISLPFFGSSKEQLDQISMDRSRNLMYLLGRNGSISVWDLGAEGEGCNKFVTIPVTKIAHEALILTQFGHDESSFHNITAIKALEASQSAALNLVATTSKGVRLYLSLSTGPQNTVGQINNSGKINERNRPQVSVRPQCLRVAHVRFAPGVTPTSIYGDGPNGVSVVYADESICAMATANRNTIFAFSNFFYPASPFFIESSTECDITGHVWEIETISRCRVNSRPPPKHLVDRVHPHPFFRSQLETKRRLLVCSNEGVFEFEQKNAVEALREALFDGGVEGTATLNLWQKLGSTEILILAFRILTSDLPVDERIRGKAEQILYSLKESPEIVDNTRLDQSTWSPNDSSMAEWKHRMKTPLLSSTPMAEGRNGAHLYSSPFSPQFDMSMSTGQHGNMKMSPSRRHDALFYYFSRLVAPVWNDTICEVHNEKQLKITFEPESIVLLREELQKLGRLMDDYRLVPTMEFGGYTSNMNDRLNAEAISLERQSLIGLRKLVDATVETLSLWLLAFDYNLTAISSGMNPQLLPNFCSRKLAHLVSDGSNLNSELIRAMIKYFLGDEAGTKQLSESLRQMCPNLYSEDDACVTFAMEQLEAARKQGAGATRRRLVQTAVEMFKQSIGKVVLATTCQQLAESVEDYEAIVELCLLRAQKDDPKQLALLAYKHGRTGSDAEMSAAEKKRADCYRVITEELDKLEEEATSEVPRDAAVNRDLMINAVLNSDDQLAHAAVFRWLLTKNKTNVILQSKSPYIEFFLVQEINAGRGQKYFDLLWRFYEKSGNYDKAARLLSKLAENDNWNMGLTQRCAYLSHAILCAQSCKDSSVTANIDDLRDRLDVANIQMRIKDALNTPRNAEVIKKLDGPILPLQELLLQFVVPFKLHKLKLALLHCAGMYIEEHIFETWESIIQDEFITARDEGSLCEKLANTIGELFHVYRDTKYFPQEFVIRRVLEIGSGGVSSETGAGQRLVLPPSFYPILCKRIELSNCGFLKIASDEFRSGGDAWWTHNSRGQEYITKVVLKLTRCVIRELESGPTSNNRYGMSLKMFESSILTGTIGNIL
ncbi:CRE-NPP-8 protein [Caenorhabditis remanei]|uniref:CRE-NPP-8 protein n=1 Tax=Caenorhabditis remanei TaxID=31234 RepID=E3N5V5_CAERE|nr:CRE-NPP-8 protein [Caenorhabditis remanei]